MKVCLRRETSQGRTVAGKVKGTERGHLRHPSPLPIMKVIIGSKHVVGNTQQVKSRKRHRMWIILPIIFEMESRVLLPSCRPARRSKKLIWVDFQSEITLQQMQQRKQLYVHSLHASNVPFISHICCLCFTRGPVLERGLEDGLTPFYRNVTYRPDARAAHRQRDKRLHCLSPFFLRDKNYLMPTKSSHFINLAFLWNWQRF